MTLLDSARDLLWRRSISRTEQQLRGHPGFSLSFARINEFLADQPMAAARGEAVAESTRRREAEWSAKMPPANWLEAPRFDGDYRFAKFRLRFAAGGVVTAPGGKPGRWIAAGRRVSLTVPDPELGGEWSWAGPIGPQALLLLGRHSSHPLPWHEEFVFVPS